jgi:hypothetical protein
MPDSKKSKKSGKADKQAGPVISTLNFFSLVIARLS